MQDMDTAPQNGEDMVEEIKPYDAWLLDPSPYNMNAVVNDLTPQIKRTLHSIGASDDAYLKSQARVLAANAVTSFDPTQGAQLNTWVDRQLQPLRRLKREKQTAVRIPDSIQLDALAISQAEDEFLEEEGREPDVRELADRVKLSVKRIEDVRRKFLREGADADIDMATSSEENPAVATENSIADFAHEAAEYVHAESDYLDRKVLEYKTGFGGKKVLSGSEIAEKLKISPAQVARRSAKISYKINEYERILGGLQ